ncbi:hypothetical protein VE02_05171 [Pseudogymnoascus sp. 03VT05]|nr:hypothetical protein VE02_05171 [Pseudogymnoascus sp. 03VT05]
MALEMSHQTSGSPPNTPTDSSWPAATAAIPEEIGASTSMLSGQFGIPTIMRPSQLLGGVPRPARPGWYAPALGEEQQNMSGTISYLNQVKLQFADRPHKYETFLQILRDYRNKVIGYTVIASLPCSTALSVPQRLAISIQPPEVTRPGTELFSPVEVQLLQPEDMPNVWAIVMLLNNGTDVTYQLGGELYQSPSDDGTFCFPGLTIPGEGMYRLRIFLYHMNFDSCPKGVAQVGCVDSNDIVIEPRPNFTTIFGSIGDVTTAQVSVAQPLLWQTVDANKCIDDHTGYFPNLKIHASTSVIIKERIEYPKVEYLKYMGLDNFGDGLFRDEDGAWSDDGKFGRADGLDESIWLGEDGEMYRKRTDGVFNGLFVGLERRVAMVVNGENSAICIAHIVLIELREEYNPKA